MKNIVMVSPVIPNNSGFGVQKRAAFHLKTLSSIYNVYLVVFDDRIEENVLSQDMKDCCSAYKIMRTLRQKRAIISQVPPFTLISELINADHKYGIPNKAVLQEAACDLDKILFEAVFCFRIRAALIFDQLEKVTALSAKKKVVDFDDIESIVTERSEKYKKYKLGLEATLVDKIRLRRTKKVENKFLKNYDDVIICSNSDKEFIEKTRRPSANIHVIPNSVPLEDIKLGKRNNRKCNILFVGTMSYGPNEDGIIWFCNEILPLIRKNTDKDLELYAVGFNPPESVRALGSIEGVTVTGGVDSVTPYYQDSDIVIAPIRYGGGTRIKILEAMSFQKAVISTTIGAEGIDIEDGKSIILADSPEDFAEACVSLIEDEDNCTNIGHAARECIEQKYSDKEVGRKLCLIFD